MSSLLDTMGYLLWTSKNFTKGFHTSPKLKWAKLETIELTRHFTLYKKEEDDLLWMHKDSLIHTCKLTDPGNHLYWTFGPSAKRFKDQ